MAYEVEVIKASRKISDRKAGGASDILRVAPYARVSTDTEEQLSSYKSQVAYYTELVNKRGAGNLLIFMQMRQSLGHRSTSVRTSSG